MNPIARGGIKADNEVSKKSNPIPVGEDHPAEARAQEPDEAPAPKVGDPDYDWAPHYPDGAELYVHTFPDGKVVAIKSFKSIYSKTWLYKVNQLKTDIDVEFAAIDRAACPAAKAVLLSLEDSSGDPLKDLYTEWMRRGDGIATGE